MNLYIYIKEKNCHMSIQVYKVSLYVYYDTNYIGNSDSNMNV